MLGKMMSTQYKMHGNDKDQSERLCSPALMCLASEDHTLRSDEEVSFEDDVASALLDSAPMRRLAGIGFLGAIDYVRKGSGRDAHRRRHNRREHSIGVAKLVETFALEMEMGVQERRTLVCAALLHDVGHGPLSHTLEQIFENRFGINHHRTTRNIIEGQSRFGSDTLEILRAFQVDPDAVLALIEGENVGQYGFLFSGPINVDTLEGITRCRAFVGPRPAFGTARAAVRRWATSGRMPTNDFDEFWSLKNSVYNLVINAPIGRLLDTVAQSYMETNIDRFAPNDFLKTEKSFRASHRELFEYLGIVLKRKNSLRDILPRKWLDVDVKISERSFFIDDSVELLSAHQSSARYKQSRNSYSVKLQELV